MASISTQFFILKDCLAQKLLSVSGLYDDAGPDSDPGSALDDFTTYLVKDLWDALPQAFRTASYETRDACHVDEEEDDLSARLGPVPPSFEDTLMAYGIVASEDDSLSTTSRNAPSTTPIPNASAFLHTILADYLSAACAPPPIWSNTRTDECELCERRVPLTYHHLIPKSTHVKAVRRGWHAESGLNAVAWLCRPCHNAVHQLAPNEELAQRYYTMELLLEREEIQRWGRYASKQRWGVRRG
ncbi:hypothetical protein HMN09_01296900 [Mycena chlorophos]|uniref:HNH domain-containing protein n=1 Tax=Mycena chlorophos TaxID=658473 RepID=A0A8H6RZY2_MYCCL|nr:hypothetical protein HMN09_01296900 [Mycena chlorophos]